MILQIAVVKAISELDLSEENFDPMKMVYIFENLIGRFYQNVDAGQYYTGRDIIKMMVSVLTAEACDDIFDDGKVITVLDQAASSGTTLISAIKNGRTRIGIEYNSDFSDLIKYKVGEDTNLNLFEKEDLQLIFNNGEFIESS